MAAMDATTGWRLLRHAETSSNGWDGHLQKLILWAGGIGSSDLAALVERWV